jgi:ABC-type ATPase with predicted acetyltransferase domain
LAGDEFKGAHAMDVAVQCDRAVGVSASPNVLAVAQMFGLGLDQHERQTIVPAMQLPIEAHTLVFVTGASGGGKSTLLNQVAQQLRAGDEGPRVFCFADLPTLPDRPLVDCFGEASLQQVLHWLARAGLNDAWVMLRRPHELSDGQRYRLRLAQLMQQVETRGPRAAERATGHADAPAHQPRAVVLADEFAATLDRTTARIIAGQLHKWTRRQAVCVLVATTHDDLLEPLMPDVLVETEAPGEMAVYRR